MMSRHYPYTTEILYKKEDRQDNLPDCWRAVSSNEDDSSVLMDGISGDKKDAEMSARSCNIAYEQAIVDVKSLFNKNGMNADLLLDSLIK